MQLNPGLHQSQLLPWQFTGKNFSVSYSNRCLKFRVPGVDMRQVLFACPARKLPKKLPVNACCRNPTALSYNLVTTPTTRLAVISACILLPVK